jgi:tetratricopeptide (TPR) repeat protein
LPKSFVLSKPFALLMLLLAGATGAAYGLHQNAPASVPTAPTEEPDDSDSSLPPLAHHPLAVHRVMDEAEFLDEYDVIGLEGYLSGMNSESGVDIRFLFARQVTGSLESYSLKRARDLGLGRDMNRRSLLFVYDVAGQRMRIEVGPGMEGMFPDGLLGFLMREQTAAFFAAGDRHLALKSTLNIVSHRLREAALGGTYNPRAVAFIKDPIRLAAGGGATARMPLGKTPAAFGTNGAAVDVAAHFGPQPTVADAFARYMEAMRDGHYEPDLGLYTPATQMLWRAFPVARPFAEYILYAEYGHKYMVVERGDVAILYFTTTPLVSAHLFRRTPKGWQIDIAAETHDTKEFVGGPYTWGMVLTGDDYSNAFSHLFADFGPTGLTDRPVNSIPSRLLRPALGDNRPLPTRNGRDPVPARIRTPRAAGLAGLLLPVIGTPAEDFGYPTQTIDRLAVRRLLLTRSYDTLDLVLSAYADSVVRDYRLEYRLFDAYAAFDVPFPSLEPVLSEWVERQPTSAAALLARGTYLTAAGWKARGHKFAGQTSRRQFVGMATYFRRAAADFTAALRLAPNSIVAYRGLMSISMNESDSAASRELLDRGLKIQPYSFRLRAFYIETLLPRWGGSYEAMMRFAEESAPYADRNPRIRALGGYVDWDRGRVLEKAGRKAEAIKAYGRAMQFGDLWLFRFERGELYFYADQNKEAAEDLTRVLVQYPQHADALYERSWVTYVMGIDASEPAKGADFVQAFEDIEMSVALDPTDEDHQKHLAFVRENIPDYAPPPQP